MEPIEYELKGQTDMTFDAPTTVLSQRIVKQAGLPQITVNILSDDPTVIDYKINEALWNQYNESIS